VSDVIRWLANLFPEAVLNLRPGDAIKRPRTWTPAEMRIRKPSREVGWTDRASGILPAPIAFDTISIGLPAGHWTAAGGRLCSDFPYRARGDDCASRARRQDEMGQIATPATGVEKSRKALDRAVIRFAGDSGDGMQLTGEQFTTSRRGRQRPRHVAQFPAEIRAPAGTLFGVSSFQLQFGSQRVYTPGDRLDCLVAMNPAALKVHLRDLKTGGLLIVNTQAFDNGTWTRRATRRTRSTTRRWLSGTGCTRSI